MGNLAPLPPHLITPTTTTSAWVPDGGLWRHSHGGTADASRQSPRRARWAAAWRAGAAGLRVDPGGALAHQDGANAAPIPQHYVGHQPVVAPVGGAEVDMTADDQRAHHSSCLGPEGLVKLGRVHAVQPDIEADPIFGGDGGAGIAVVAGDDDRIECPGGARHRDGTGADAGEDPAGGNCRDVHVFRSNRTAGSAR